MNTLIQKERIFKTLEDIRDDIGDDIFEYLVEEWEL